MQRVLLIFGTRPEAIKMAPVYNALLADGRLEVRVCVTAQHREMLDQVLRIFDIQPHYDLNLMQSRQDLFDITASVLVGLKEVLTDYAPDVVLVHGDTTTAMAASLAAFYKKVKVAHVESGLRTRDLASPWPEEANRQLIGRLASLHFAPTENARRNLLAEHVDDHSIFVTGNTVIDALQQITRRIEADQHLLASLHRQFEFLDDTRRLIVVTGHRRENFGAGLENICKALLRLSERDDVQIVYPVHLNPNVKDVVVGALSQSPRVHLIEPLEYLPFAYLLKRAYLVLTDSGGIQEEAPSLGKPVLVMRSNTERPEAVQAGTVRLIGADAERIVAGARELLDDPAQYMSMARAENPYGDGLAAVRIADIVANHLAAGQNRESSDT